MHLLLQDLCALQKRMCAIGKAGELSRILRKLLPGFIVIVKEIRKNNLRGYLRVTDK